MIFWFAFSCDDVILRSCQAGVWSFGLMVLTAQQHGPSKSMDATCPCCLLSGCFRHCIDTYNILQKTSCLMDSGLQIIYACFNAWILSRKQAMIPAAFLCVMMQFPNCPDLLRQGVGQWWGRILADSWANAFDCTYDLCLSLYSHTYVRVMCVHVGLNRAFWAQSKFMLCSCLMMPLFYVIRESCISPTLYSNLFNSCLTSSCVKVWRMAHGWLTPISSPQPTYQIPYQMDWSLYQSYSKSYTTLVLNSLRHLFLSETITSPFSPRK